MRRNQLSQQAIEIGIATEAFRREAKQVGAGETEEAGGLIASVRREFGRWTGPI